MRQSSVAVWDPLVRLFHWSLAVSFVIAWLTADEWESLHIWAGYAAGALVAFRVLWGVVGPRYARFAQFMRPPATTLSYLGATLRGREPRYIGHNPLGALMIVALMLGLAATAVTGWMHTLDAFWGVEWVEETHELLANVMLALVSLHVAGVVFASLRHGENLVRAMVVGRKRAPAETDIA
jgi:cytochrome b